jgi:hypothetical protein
MFREISVSPMIDAYAAVGSFRSHRLASRSRVGSVDCRPRQCWHVRAMS